MGNYLQYRLNNGKTTYSMHIARSILGINAGKTIAHRYYLSCMHCLHFKQHNYSYLTLLRGIFRNVAMCKGRQKGGVMHNADVY